MKRSLLVWVFVVAVCGLSACSTQTGGTAVPSSTGAGSSGSAESGVPKVSQPLDPSAYLTEPCKVVPDSVMAELGFTKPGEPEAASAAGPLCTWAKGAKGAAVSILTRNRDRGAGGLDAVYANKGSLYKYVDPAPDVEGYPAVFADIRDARSRGECGIFVGIADNLTFHVNNSGYQGEQDSCDAVQKVAAAVVKTLKGA